MTAHAERAHARFSPSASVRWLACPGSIRASDGLDDASSEDAAEGTAAHELGDHCLKTGANAADQLGRTFHGHVVDEAMAGAVQIYIDAVRAELAAHPGAILAVEQRADLTWLHPELWGSYDAMVLVPFAHAVVFDLKYGRHTVEAAGNTQLGLYALDPWHRADVQQVDAVIVQPRAPHDDGPIRRARWTGEALAAFAERIRMATAAADAVEAARCAGDHCRFCRAKATCTALHRHAITVAQVEFAPAEPLPRTLVPPDPQALTQEQLALVLQHGAVIRDWLDAVRSHARSVLKSGAAIPGYKLVAGDRQWANPDAATAKLRDLGVDPFERKLLTPAKAENAVIARQSAQAAEVGMKVTKKSIGERFRVTFDDLITRGEPEVAKAADRRPAISMSAAADFTPVDGTAAT
jgi:hypothetical protein